MYLKVSQTLIRQLYMSFFFVSTRGSYCAVLKIFDDLKFASKFRVGINLAPFVLDIANI